MKNEMTIEEMLKELEKIVNELSSDEVDLEKSLELFSKGVILSKECQNRLDKTKQIVEERRKEL